MQVLRRRRRRATLLPQWCVHYSSAPRFITQRSDNFAWPSIQDVASFRGPATRQGAPGVRAKGDASIRAGVEGGRGQFLPFAEVATKCSPEIRPPCATREELISPCVSSAQYISPCRSRRAVPDFVGPRRTPFCEAHRRLDLRTCDSRPPPRSGDSASARLEPTTRSHVPVVSAGDVSWLSERGRPVD